MADYKKLIHTELTFTPSDQLLTSYVWKVDGVQESTLRIFKKTFTSLGVKTVTLEGSSCANCVPVSITIEIVESVSVTPPQVPSLTPIIVGSVVVVVAVLGTIVLLARKKK